MKTYFRLLTFASPLIGYMVPFFILSLLSIFFGMFTITLVIPLLDIIFDKVPQQVILSEPAFRVDVYYVKELFTYYFTNIVAKGKTEALQMVCTVVVISNLLSNLFKYLSQIILIKLKGAVILRLRNEMFQKLTVIHLGYFFDHKKGDILSRFTNDVSNVESCIVNSIQNILRDPITIVAYFIFLFVSSPTLTFYSLIIFPISGLIISQISKRLRSDSGEISKSHGRIVSILDETISGMRIILAFNARKFVQEKFRAENKFGTSKYKRFLYTYELSSPLSEFLGILVVASILWIGGQMVLSNSGELKASEFITYLITFSQILSPAKSFSSAISNIQKGLVSGERIFEVLDTKSEIQDKADALVINDFSKQIEFENVEFYYGEKCVFNKLNLVIPKGKTLALVGGSGGGKSTLADLIPRFYDTLRGEVKIDGVNIKNFTQESIRSLMGIVTQKAILFNDTIFNNIAFGKPGATEEEVIAAAKIANAHEFIMQTSEGYQTNIGEQGSKLSGGQQQRISIARAILKNPPILILDEATSALDSESEKLVQDALNNLMKNRTSVVIAHRLSTIQSADLIVVLHKGEIVERGTHQELVNLNGSYNKLISLQGVK